jgi:hypothetical protein
VPAWSMSILQTSEIASAAARIPVGLVSNHVNLKKNKTKLDHFFILANDFLRLTSESLAILTKQGESDFHTYDYFWIGYDSASLLTGVTQF